MSEYYVDASTGSDTNAGTSGAPFATIQKALDSSTGGDIINLSNSAAFVLSAQLNFTAFGAATRDAPLLIRSWDNGGSITISMPTVGGVAQTIVAAEIDGNDAISSIFGGTLEKWVIFQGLKFHSTTGTLINRNQGWVMYNCEMYDCSGQYLCGVASGDAHVVDCYIHDDGFSGVDGLHLRQSTSTGNYIKNVSGNGINANTTTYNTIMNNVINGFGENGIYATKDATGILHNTINDATGASGDGINIGSGSEFNIVKNNIITNVDSTGSAINITSGGNNAINGPNAFYNNTTNNGGATNPASCIDLTGDDVTESSSPYDDAASGDFRIASTANAYESAPIPFGGAEVTKSNYGAFSPGKIASAGGAVQTSHVSVGG